MYKIIEKTNKVAILQNETTKALIELKCIRTDAEYGNFYAFNTIYQMPIQRKLMFDMIQQYATLGIDKDDLQNDINEIKQICVNKPADGYNIIYNFVANQEVKIKSFWDYQKTSLLMVGLFIIPENELLQIGYFSQEKITENITNWSKDSELIDFFLSIAHLNLTNSINQFSQISKINTNQM
jgi:hypothetical protein